MPDSHIVSYRIAIASLMSDDETGGEQRLTNAPLQKGSELFGTMEGNPKIKEETPQDIFLFIPNIIGFARVILAIISFYYMPTNYHVAVFCYVTSALLDALDGHAARYFNQCTKFGAILDQLTDRCGTLGLIVTLSQFYPAYTFWFQLSVVIDISCHWIHLHATLLQGKTSHKFFTLDDNPIMRLYYTNRQVLFVMCAAYEAFFSSLYLLHFTSGPFGIFRIVPIITGPLMLIKTGISVLHGYLAANNMALIDIKERAESCK